VDTETERDRLLKMYAQEPVTIKNTVLNQDSSCSDFERADSQSLAKTNSRPNIKQSKQSLSDTDFDLTKTYGQTQGKTSSLVDFNLTKT
jgi:hypothetical protein